MSHGGRGNTGYANLKSMWAHGGGWLTVIKFGLQPALGGHPRERVAHGRVQGGQENQHGLPGEVTKRAAHMNLRSLLV